MSTVPLRVFEPAGVAGSNAPSPMSPEEERRRRRRRRRRWRLRDLYERHVLPRVLAVRSRAPSPQTVRFYESALDRWERLSGDPPIGAIGDAVAAAWVRALAASTWRGRPLADATIRRHAKYVQQILDCAGPDRMHGRRRIRGARILPAKRIPYLIPDAIHLPSRPPYTLEQVFDWIEYLRTRGTALDMPALGIDPSRWMEAWIVFLHNTGARPGMAWHVERSHLDGRGEWLLVPRELVKGGRRPLEIYLNEPARRAIAQLERPGRDRLFGVGRWADRKPAIYRAVRIDLARALLPPLGFYGLRRLFSTLLVGSGKPLVSAWMMGHAPPRDLRMQANHYADRRALIAAAMDIHPQPGRPRQLELF